MLEILGYVFVFWISYRLLVSYFELRALEKNVGVAVELIEEHSKNLIVVFERVKHNDEDVILCYDVDNNFIVQGATKEEVIEKGLDEAFVVAYKNGKQITIDEAKSLTGGK